MNNHLKLIIDLYLYLYIINFTYAKAANKNQIDIDTIIHILGNCNLSSLKKIDKLQLLLTKHKKLLTQNILVEEENDTKFFEILGKLKGIIIIINKWLGTTSDKIINYLIDEVLQHNLLE